MGQQLFNLAVLVRRQARQYIFEVGIRIMSIETGTLNQAHDGGRTLPGPERAGK